MKESAQFVIMDKPLKCNHCDTGRFGVRRAQLNTAFASFMGIDFLNESAHVFTCASCGHLHWFMGLSEEDIVRLDPRDGVQRDDYPINCLSCGARIPAGESRCPACDWTYSE